MEIPNEAGERLLKKAELRDKFNPAPIFTVISFNLAGEFRKSEVKETGKEQLARWKTVERPRCVGYYHDFEHAEWSVINNSGDMNEAGYYNMIVIEQVEPGLYPSDPLNHRWFYKWEKPPLADGYYVKLDHFEDPLFDVVSYGFIG